jgi:hypothetical protein
MLRDQASLRGLAISLAATRALIGVAFLVAPRRFGRLWIGEAADRPSTQMALRALGGRDLALAVGTLGALDRDGAARPWLVAGAVVDGVDTVAVLAARRDLRWWRVVLTAAAAGGGLLLGAHLAAHLDR